MRKQYYATKKRVRRISIRFYFCHVYFGNNNTKFFIVLTVDLLLPTLKNKMLGLTVTFNVRKTEFNAKQYKCNNYNKNKILFLPCFF